MISWQSISSNGVGRLTKRYFTDGGGDSAWSDADDVSGDIVLNQQEFTYDGAGNVIFAINRDQIFDQLWAVASMSQALTWSVGGKNPGGNADSGTWLP